MHITMNQTRRGSEDGFTVRCFESGETYEVGHTLGTQFVRNRWATEVEPAATQEA